MNVARRLEPRRVLIEERQPLVGPVKLCRRRGAEARCPRPDAVGRRNLGREELEEISGLRQRTVEVVRHRIRL